MEIRNEDRREVAGVQGARYQSLAELQGLERKVGAVSDETDNVKAQITALMRLRQQGREVEDADIELLETRIEGLTDAIGALSALAQGMAYDFA